MNPTNFLISCIIVYVLALPVVLYTMAAKRNRREAALLHQKMDELKARIAVAEKRERENFWAIEARNNASMISMGGNYHGREYNNAIPLSSNVIPRTDGR